MNQSNDVFYTIDIGVNFAGKTYNSAKVKQIINESADCVTNIITITNSLKELPINKKLCGENNNLYYTAGVHPHDAHTISNINQLNIIKLEAKNNRFVAVGECGLDYNRMFSPKEKQIEVFIAQIEIAKLLGMPLYMHCRDAFDDFYSIVKSSGYSNGVVHCFTGTKEQAKLLCELGFYLGITGWIYDRKRNENLIEAIKTIPLNKILVETDAPWLSIDKSRQSHPLDTGDIVHEIARIKKIDEIKCGKQIYANTKTLFKNLIV